MKDCKHIEEEEIRELSLIVDDDFEKLMEERHYVHTIHDFVELIVVYGWDKVTSDLRTAMGEKQW